MERLDEADQVDVGYINNINFIDKQPYSAIDIPSHYT